MSAPSMLGPDGSIDDYLGTLVRTSRGRLIRSPECDRVVFRGDLCGDDLRGRVALISGGGSGHEPSFAGYVGPGALTAAVVGNLFASPPVNHILGAMRGVSEGASGILLLPMNYTGDRLNFGMALHKFKSLYPNTPAEMLVIQDDVGTAEDKRGVAGTILVHKIAGAMANLGKKLQEIIQFLTGKVLPKLGSIGLSLSPLRLPGRDEDSFHLKDGEMELGTGIHGEAGVKRLKLQSAKESAITMLNQFIELDLKNKESVVLLVNNLGGTSQLELGVMAGEAAHLLEEKGMKVERVYSGSFMTSLRMVGFSFTLLKLGVNPDEALGGVFATTNPEVLRYLDAPICTPAWSGPSWNSQSMAVNSTEIKFTVETELNAGPKLESKLAVEGVRKALIFACEALSSCDGQLNTMDTGAGDGDTGTTMKNGADQVLLLHSKKEIDPSHPVKLLRTLSSIAENEMGGTSGALYSIFFSTLSNHFSLNGGDYSFPSYIKALDKGATAISKYGESQLGDRTLLDALIPYISSFQSSSEEQDFLSRFDKATTAAEEGAMATLGMRAKVGRAARVAPSELVHSDPGAHAVGIICRAINEAIKRVYS